MVGWCFSADVGQRSGGELVHVGFLPAFILVSRAYASCLLVVVVVVEGGERKTAQYHCLMFIN